MHIQGNKIVFPTHMVVCDPVCADQAYMEFMYEELLECAKKHTPREHARVLRECNNDGTWGIKILRNISKSVL